MSSRKSDENLGDSLNIRLPEGIRDKLELEAKREGIYLSQKIRKILTDYIESPENLPSHVQDLGSDVQDLESDIDLLKERIKKLEKVIEVSNALQNTLVKNPDLFQEVFERATGLKIRIVDE